MTACATRNAGAAWVCMLTLASWAFAQTESWKLTTFEVDVVKKSAVNPYFGLGHPDGYRIDGVEGATIQLYRTVRYVFQMIDVPQSHPFYISTDSAGGFPFIGEYLEGVVNSGASVNQTLEFTPSLSAPSPLFYQCGLHEYMGYRIELLDPPCYADCDTSTGAGMLDIFDFLCFQNSFVNTEPYACDCDTSTGVLVCDIFDFLCFQNSYVGGCP